MRLMIRILTQNDGEMVKQGELFFQTSPVIFLTPSLVEFKPLLSLVDHREEMESSKLDAVNQIALGTRNLLSAYANKQSHPLFHIPHNTLVHLFCIFMSNCLVISDPEMKEV